MKKENKGFSLLEVSLILIIIGIIGVAAVPSIQNIRRQEVNKLAKEICLDLVTQRAKQQIDSKADYTLTLENGGAGTSYYGYKIVKNLAAAVTELDTKRLDNGQQMKIIISDIDLSATSGFDPTSAGYTPPAPLITSLEFKDGKMFCNGSATSTSTIYFILVSDKSWMKIVFEFETGHYEISAPR